MLKRWKNLVDHLQNSKQKIDIQICFNIKFLSNFILKEFVCFAKTSRFIKLNKHGFWISISKSNHHPLDSQNKVLQSLHASLVGYYCLAPLAGRKASCSLRFSQAYVGSYFNWYTPEYVFDSTAVGKAP